MRSVSEHFAMFIPWLPYTHVGKRPNRSISSRPAIIETDGFYHKGALRIDVFLSPRGEMESVVRTEDLRAYSSKDNKTFWLKFRFNNSLAVLLDKME